MKDTLRMTALLLALLWTLAWTAAGREPAAPTREPPEQTEQEAAQPRSLGARQGSSAAAPSGTADQSRTLRVSIGGSVREMAMDEYLVGVLRAEMPASFEMEALKAQAVAARTYTLHKMASGPIAAHPEADACDDIACCKAYKSAEDAAAEWGTRAAEYEEKLSRAVRETDGEVILYEGEPILAVFCSSTNGHTQNAGAVWQQDLPYLKSVDSPEREDLVPNYYSSVTFTAEEFRSLLLSARPDAVLTGPCGSWITDLRRSEAGFVTSLRVGGVEVRGNELRTILSLRSPSFTVEASGEQLTFHVTGYGHGVGMSQYGANILASEGKTCEEILAHYFTGTRVGPWE